MGSIKSRRCNLRVVLEAAGELPTELEALRSRLDWAMDSSLFFGSIWLKGLDRFLSLAAVACRVSLCDLYAALPRLAAFRVSW